MDTALEEYIRKAKEDKTLSREERDMLIASKMVTVCIAKMIDSLVVVEGSKKEKYITVKNGDEIVMSGRIFKLKGENVKNVMK